MVPGRRVIVGVSALVALLVVTYACGGSANTADSPAGGAGDAAAGKALYQESCASCHGDALQGTDTGPSFLSPIYAPGHHGDAAFYLAVAQGVVPHHFDFGTMPPLSGLAEQDVADIVAYVRQQQRAEGIE